MIRKQLVCLIATALLVGCGAGETYQLPAKDVRSKLLSLSPPMFVFGSGGVSSMVSQVGQDQVRWTLLQSGTALMSLTATVTPEGDSATSVAVVAEPAPGKGNSKIARGMADHPEIVELYRKAMEEQIDSKLEGRDFDMGAIQGQMMTAVVSNMGEMDKQFDEAAKRFKEQDRERESRLVAERDEEQNREIEAAANDGEAVSYNE